MRNKLELTGVVLAIVSFVSLMVSFAAMWVVVNRQVARIDELQGEVDEFREFRLNIEEAYLPSEDCRQTIPGDTLDNLSVEMFGSPLNLYVGEIVVCTDVTDGWCEVAVPALEWGNSPFAELEPGLWVCPVTPGGE